MIPRRIFQTWKNKTIHDNEVMKRCQVTWLKHNPSFEYVLWDDFDNRNFIAQHFPEFLPIYDDYDINIKRVDAVRYFYLYKYGGIYTDLDFECLKSFDGLLEAADLIESDVVLGQLGEMDNDMFSVHKIPNALMIAKPNSDFFRFVIDVMINVASNKNLGAEAATGPILLTLCYDYYCNYSKLPDCLFELYGKDIFENILKHGSSQVTVTMPEIFYPINWANKKSLEKRVYMTNEQAILNFPNSFAVTYWLHSWE
jgi:mannosyltransferase OCH1-like enzyme